MIEYLTLYCAMSAMSICLNAFCFFGLRICRDGMILETDGILWLLILTFIPPMGVLGASFTLLICIIRGINLNFNKK